MNTTFRVLTADITTLSVDAIVNAANSDLAGGGGVDGAIHRAAGDDLYQFCRTLGGCEVGNAKITPGFKLKARWIIHTVGPIWSGGGSEEARLLGSCYREALLLAEKYNVLSIAFPSISTGAYGFPIDLASSIAVTEVAKYVSKKPFIEVTFVCFSEADSGIYRQRVRELHGS